MKKHILILSTLMALLSIGSAAAANPNVLDLKYCITDSTIVYPESYEIDTQEMLESWYIKNYTVTDNRYHTVPDANVSDEVYVERLKALPTVIEMPFNQIVKSYITRYTEKGRAQVAVLLGLSHYYTPIFEQALEAEGLPLELKYLPIVESGLDPNAVSKSGAAGLWQFILATANGMGMEVNSLVDERRDPYKSSQCAAAYLKDLYQTYNDWSLAIAAYNCGPGEVNKALRRAGGDPKSHDFWSIYNLLRAETRGYVPMFIAANYVMNYYQDHNISPVLATQPLVTDTVAVKERLHLQQVSDVLNIPIDELRILNPQYRADIVPGTVDKPYYLILPSQQAYAYIVSEKEIFAQDKEKYAQRGVVEPGITDSRQTTDVVAQATPTSVQTTYIIKHKVVSGETLSQIAKKYGVTNAQIKEWNNLRRNSVRVGQQLRITTADPAYAHLAQPATTEAAQAPATQQQTQTTATPSKKKKEKESKSKTYTVRKGDTLDKIARKHGVTTSELRKANPKIKGDKIHPGDKLKIPAKKSSKKKKRR